MKFMSGIYFCVYLGNVILALIILAYSLVNCDDTALLDLEMPLQPALKTSGLTAWVAHSMYYFRRAYLDVCDKCSPPAEKPPANRPGAGGNAPLAGGALPGQQTQTHGVQTNDQILSVNDKIQAATLLKLVMAVSKKSEKAPKTGAITGTE